MSAKKKNIISKASPHTIKKFELIEEYIKSWAQKLLLTESCNGLIFIDCMCRCIHRRCWTIGERYSSTRLRST